MVKYFRDETGRMVGFVKKDGEQLMYFDDKSRLAARISDNRTYDNHGRFRGNGDQGLRVLGEKRD